MTEDVFELRPIEAAPAVERPGWEEIYDRLGAKIHRFLYRMTGRPELAADLTHDTFVRVFEKLDLYDGRGSLESWVYRIAGNLARDHLKRPHPFVSRSAIPTADDPPPARVATEPVLRLALRQALDRLPDDYRVTLLLHDADGFTHDEIARLLDVAPGTSKARLSRARARLREELRSHRGC